MVTAGYSAFRLVRCGVVVLELLGALELGETNICNYSRSCIGTGRRVGVYSRGA
jgi:hypothetical protein